MIFNASSTNKFRKFCVETLMCWCLQFSNASISQPIAWLNVKKIVKEQTEPHWFWYIKLLRKQYMYNVYADDYIFHSHINNISIKSHVFLFFSFALTEPFKVECKLKTYFAFMPCQCRMSYVLCHWMIVISLVTNFEERIIWKTKEKLKNSSLYSCHLWVFSV